MNGPNCPKDKSHGESEYLSTTNEWKYYCKKCDKRFNVYDEFMPDEVPLMIPIRIVGGATNGISFRNTSNIRNNFTIKDNETKD